MSVEVFCLYLVLSFQNVILLLFTFCHRVGEGGRVEVVEQSIVKGEIGR